MKEHRFIMHVEKSSSNCSTIEKQNVDIDIEEYYGITPLDCACENDHFLTIVEYLISKGTNNNTKDNHKKHHYILFFFFSFFQILIKITLSYT